VFESSRKENIQKLDSLLGFALVTQWYNTTCEPKILPPPAQGEVKWENVHYFALVSVNLS
jgi:hypothetical protein